MRQYPEAEAVEQKMWWIGQLRAVGYVSASFFLALATLWIFEFSASPWQALLALSLSSFSVSWIATVPGVRTLLWRLAEEDAIPGPKPETAALLAKSGVFLGVFAFVAFFLINGS